MKESRDRRSSTGRAGEAAALEYLLHRGYSLLTRNYRCRLGEMDLIMRRGEKIAFVEVRSRRGVGFGQPQESIRSEKLARLQRIAQYYLGYELKGTWKGLVNIEVVAVTFHGDGQVKSIEHISDVS